MKFILRWVFRLLVLLLLGSLAVLLLKDSLLKELIETRLGQRTGLQAQIGRAGFQLLSPTVSLQDARLFNPAEFGGTAFLEIPDGHLEYDRAALAAGRLRIRLLRLHVSELVLARDPQGRLNLPLIRDQIAARADRSLIPGLQFDGIETLNLTLESVRAYQVGLKTPPLVFHLGLRNEILRDLRTPADVERALLALAARLGLSALLGPSLSLPDPAPARPAPR